VRLFKKNVPNDDSEPARDDFTALTEAGHWLEWLGEEPGLAVRESIELTLDQQVAGAKVQWLRFTGEPAFLTGGKPVAGDPGKVQAVRAGLAVQFVLGVVEPSGRRDVVSGVFSLVVAGMDEVEWRSRSWLDLGATMEQIGPLLEARIYEVDQAD
jgi:hypothetical protein